jgi:hypothetical protein
MRVSELINRVIRGEEGKTARADTVEVAGALGDGHRVSPAMLGALLCGGHSAPAGCGTLLAGHAAPRHTAP